MNLIDPIIDPKETIRRLIKWQKNMEKGMITSFVALGASDQCRVKTSRIENEAKEIQQQTKESLTTISHSLGNVLKGDFGKRAKELLKESAEEFK